MTPVLQIIDILERKMKLTPPPPKHQIVIDPKTGKPKARPPRMSTSAKIAKKKAAEKPRLTKRIKGSQAP